MSVDMYRWWIRDAKGIERLTGVLMTREEALQRFPDAKPELSSRLDVLVEDDRQSGDSSRFDRAA